MLHESGSLFSATTCRKQMYTSEAYLQVTNINMIIEMYFAAACYNYHIQKSRWWGGCHYKTQQGQSWPTFIMMVTLCKCNLIGCPSALNSSSMKGPMLVTVEASSSA